MATHLAIAVAGWLAGGETSMRTMVDWARGRVDQVAVDGLASLRFVSEDESRVALCHRCRRSAVMIACVIQSSDVVHPFHASVEALLAPGQKVLKGRLSRDRLECFRSHTHALHYG